MQSHPCSSAPDVRDVIAAWIVCLAIAVGCFGFLAPAKPGGGGAPAALNYPDPIATLAAAKDHRSGRC